MQRILVIDNHDSFVYNLVQLLKYNGHCHFEVTANDRIEMLRVHRYDKVLLSPGPGIPQEAGKLSELIGYCKNTHPILGVCLGHQAIAEVFGARLLQLPFPRHGHSSPLQFTSAEDPIFRNIPGDIRVGRYHSWTVDPDSLPEELKISAIDEEEHIMAFFHTRLPIHGLQFHPESVITRYGQRIINNWIDE